MSETQVQTLDRILSELQSEESATRLAAMNELGNLSYSSSNILQLIEHIAMNDPQPAARRLALELLQSPTHRYIRGTTSHLPRGTRMVVLEEIKQWQGDGLIPAEQADVLRGRYDFDIAPTTRVSAQRVAPAEPVPTPGLTPAEEASEEGVTASMPPKPSLTQRLLSQATVNVFLYLGAFLVIGAALILAALVEAARLPILEGVAVVFAASAIVLKKRLPQPSFALFIVFSFLLPILARVLGESLKLSGSLVYAYWSLVLFLMAAIWAFSTWFYASRLFSLVSYISLALGAISFARIFTTSTDWLALAAGIGTLMGLTGVLLLKTWKGDKFALPLSLTVHAAQLIVLFVSFVSVSSHLIGTFDASVNVTGASWFAITTTWLVAALFYGWCAQFYEFALLPWASVAALMPVAWLLPQALHVAELGYTGSFWVWGVLFAAASEMLVRTGSTKSRNFSMPLLFGSVALFACAALSGLIGEIVHGFSALVGAAIVYTVLQIVRPRWHVWTLALLAGLGAFFSFFALPMFAQHPVEAGYQLLGASLLLMVPELFTKFPEGWGGAWRKPLVVLGAFVVLCSIALELSTLEPTPRTAIITFAVYALLFVAYALHFHRPALGYLGTASAATAVFFALWPIRGETWLPVFTGLSLAYYAAGLVLRSREYSRGWGRVLCFSGLVLGTLVPFAALIVLTKAGAPYSIAIALLFFAEVYLGPDDRLEALGPTFLTIAAILALPYRSPDELTRLLLAISLIWLAADAIYHRTLSSRRLSVITRLAGGTVVFANTLLLVAFGPDAKQAAICFGIYAAVFAFDAWLYKLPELGYATTAFLPLAVFFALRAAGQHNWLYAIVALAVLYYAAGYLLRRRPQSEGWSRVLLTSGLALGTINALSAPLQSGLPAAIPVAIAASLFAVEAFALSNVWLGFPANLLYLEAYFLILLWLNVDQPQFYSVGAAVLGILMHYLLTRAGSRTGAFLTGMFSQLVLLGTTYVQLFSTQRLGFFTVIFFQGLTMLAYGIVIRSRSLVITPIIFIVLSVFTVVYGALKGISTVILIGCSGILLLLLGILAVVLRERLTKFGDQWSTWRA